MCLGVHDFLFLYFSDIREWEWTQVLFSSCFYLFLQECLPPKEHRFLLMRCLPCAGWIFPSDPVRQFFSPILRTASNSGSVTFLHCYLVGFRSSARGTHCCLERRIPMTGLKLEKQHRPITFSDDFRITLLSHL